MLFYIDHKLINIPVLNPFFLVFNRFSPFSTVFTFFHSFESVLPSVNAERFSVCHMWDFFISILLICFVTVYGIFYTFQYSRSKVSNFILGNEENLNQKQIVYIKTRPGSNIATRFAFFQTFIIAVALTVGCLSEYFFLFSCPHRN